MQINNTHTTVLRPFFRHYCGEQVPEEKTSSGVYGAREDNIDTLTIRLGATPSGLISDPPPSSPHFTPDALPVATRNPPNFNLSWLGTGTKCDTQ